MPGKDDREYQQAIQKAKSINILSIVGSAVPLKKHADTRKSGREYCGPCPRCGGVDRFVVRTGPNDWTCRGGKGLSCSNGKWEDPISLYALMHFGTSQPTGEIFKRCVEELTGVGTAFTPAPIVHKPAEEIDAERQAALAQFTRAYTTEELYRNWYTRLEAEQRAWWEGRGIPIDWQEVWQLGYVPDREFRDRDQPFHSPAYTIPYFAPAEPGVDWHTRPVNMQFRLVNPLRPQDKYRWVGRLGSSPYCVYPTFKTDEVFVTEGAIKGMNLGIYLVPDKEIWAMPSKHDFARLPEMLSSRGRVWVIVDPDGEDRADLFAAQTGPQARIVILPGKLDDLILLNGLNQEDLHWALRRGRPASLEARAAVARQRKAGSN